jgi:hypothetical protein
MTTLQRGTETCLQTDYPGKSWTRQGPARQFTNIDSHTIRAGTRLPFNCFSSFPGQLANAMPAAAAWPTSCLILGIQLL